MANARVSSKIPVFDSDAEEAAFWDTHSTTEFEDEWEPVDVEFASDLKHRRIVEITLDDETADALFGLARQRGVRSAELALPWVKDGLARALRDGRDHHDAATARPDEI